MNLNADALALSEDQAIFLLKLPCLALLDMVIIVWVMLESLFDVIS